MKLKLTKPRKIISLDYSFLISLPHTWLEHHHIGKGSLVDFTVNEDGYLVVIPIKEENETQN